MRRIFQTLGMKKKKTARYFIVTIFLDDGGRIIKTCVGFFDIAPSRHLRMDQTIEAERKSQKRE